ncbi:MAG: Uma2 family endonuclease [Tepidisphaeraceae bacterium]
MTTQTESTEAATPAIPVLRGTALSQPTKKKVRFTVKQYLRLDRAGLFDDTRVELILGRIYPMHAQANPHQWAISKGSRRLLQVFPPDTHWVVIQGTLLLEPDGAPDPDFHVFDTPEGQDKGNRKPFLLIEISDSTYRKDSGVKLVQYAKSGITDYWIVNIAERRVEVYRQPDPYAGLDGKWGYALKLRYEPGQSIAPLARPDLSIAVNELLP